MPIDSIKQDTVSESSLKIEPRDKRTALFSGGELAVVQLCVGAALLKQLFVGALFHHVARVHDQDHVRVLDGGKTVSDNEAGAPAHQFFERLLYKVLAFVVQGAGRLVKKEDARPPDERTGDEDALLLAAAGFHVQLFEHDPVIAALLADGLARAAADPQLSPIVARMRLTSGDSVQALTARASMDVAKPDVVYLDPMFPARQKSAAVKKKFQLLHHLEAPCTDEEGLLRAAIACGPRKVVIKRPAKGPYLAGIKPSYSIDGKAVRYDCIIPASMKL